jgi:hypothetical protein
MGEKERWGRRVGVPGESSENVLLGDSSVTEMGDHSDGEATVSFCSHRCGENMLLMRSVVRSISSSAALISADGRAALQACCVCASS